MTEKRCVGVTVDVHMDQRNLTELTDLARHIEGLGYESLWSSDAMVREPYLLAAYLLANTKDIRIGTGIANMYGRDPMAAAQARLTISEQYPERFLMGLGVSVAFMNEQRGAETIAPTVKQEQYLRGIQEAMVAVPSATPIAPLYAAAHGPKMQAIASDYANGIMTWVMPPQHITLSRKRIPDSKWINAEVTVINEEDPEIARETARSFISLWMQLPHYRSAWLDAGFGEEDFEHGGSNRFVDALFAWGGLDQIVAKLDEYRDAGANRILINPLSYSRTTSDHAGFEQNVRPAWDVLEGIAARIF